MECVEDNRKNNSVLKAFRMCGWCAFRPTSKGLVRANGPEYAKLPLGSSRLSNRVMEQRSFIQWARGGGGVGGENKCPPLPPLPRPL